MNSTLDVSNSFYNELLGFLRKRVSNPIDAEDILQDALQKATERIHTLEDDTKLNAWLYQILRNALIDFYRSRSKAQAMNAQDYPTIPEFPEANDNAAMIKCIRPLIDELPDSYREAITKTDLEGQSQVALANELDLSVSGAKSRVQRARGLLKDKITQCCTIIHDRYGNIVEHECKNPECGCDSD